MDHRERHAGAGRGGDGVLGEIGAHPRQRVRDAQPFEHHGIDHLAAGGDGLGEQCDDGNAKSNDGCGST